jgi:hypothetical protein
MKKFLMIAALVAAPAVLADGPSYSYLNAAIQIGEMEFGAPVSGTTDADGFSYTGSFAINDNVFAQIDMLDLGTGGDAQIGSATINSLSFGWHNDMFFARLGYEWQHGPEVFIPAGGSGYLVDFGVRTIVGETFEVSAHYGMSEGGASFGSSTFYGVGAVFMFSEDMGVSFNYDLRKVSDYAEAFIGPGLDVDANNYGLGFRYNFN